MILPKMPSEVEKAGRIDGKQSVLDRVSPHPPSLRYGAAGCSPHHAVQGEPRFDFFACIGTMNWILKRLAGTLAPTTAVTEGRYRFHGRRSAACLPDAWVQMHGFFGEIRPWLFPPMGEKKKQVWAAQQGPRPVQPCRVGKVHRDWTRTRKAQPRCSGWVSVWN